MKALGATGSHVFGLMLLQVMIIAAIGMAIGAAVGAALPFLAPRSSARSCHFLWRRRSIRPRSRPDVFTAY